MSKNSEMFKRFRVTESQLRNSEHIIKYRINDKVYKFSVPEDELYEDFPYAYCLTTRRWVWLYPKHVFVEGLGVVPAEKIG